MGLLPIDRALLQLLAPLTAVSDEWVPTTLSLGRTLSEPIKAPEAFPFDHNSAMDGYALKAGAGPWTIVGESAAGSPYGDPLDSNQAVRIFTGGVVPQGADSILIQENALVDGRRLTSASPVRLGQHIRHCGSDLAQGQALLDRGATVLPPDLGTLAGLGIEQLKCTRQPRVSIYSTGDELIPLGFPRETGQVYDSNALQLRHAVEAAGAQIVHCSHLPDDRQLIDDTLKDREADSDLILLSGGVSVGDHDHVAKALKAIGGELTFYKVAMKPGKPVAAAQINECTVLGLPGNPASAMVSFEIFARPVIKTLLGANRVHRSLNLAPCPVALPAGGKRHEFLRARLGANEVTPNTRQGSGDLSSLLQADALIFRPAHAPASAPGQNQAYLNLSGRDSECPPEAQWANRN